MSEAVKARCRALDNGQAITPQQMGAQLAPLKEERRETRDDQQDKRERREITDKREFMIRETTETLMMNGKKKEGRKEGRG